LISSEQANEGDAIYVEECMLKNVEEAAALCRSIVLYATLGPGALLLQDEAIKILQTGNAKSGMSFVGVRMSAEMRATGHFDHGNIESGRYNARRCKPQRHLEMGMPPALHRFICTG
jgi:hypothetical protein